MERRLRELLDALPLRHWSRQESRVKDGPSRRDKLWMQALRRADDLPHGREYGDTRLLISLLRSDRKMPDGLEMSRMARELLAELLERWRVKKRDKRLTTLFTPDLTERLRTAAREVRRLQYGGYPRQQPSGPFILPELSGVLEPIMSRKKAVAKVAKQEKLPEHKLRALIEGKDSLLRRENRRPGSKKVTRT
jgi:hypothetical protein